MTLKDIAGLAGVSTATVSNVLNKNDAKVSSEVRDRIIQIIEQHDYVPNKIAKSLRIKKTNTIGVITEDIKHFLTPEILTGINAYAEKAEKHIILYDLGMMKKTGEDTEKTKLFQDNINDAFSILSSAMVDGIIYVAWQDRDIGELIRTIDTPIVYSFCYNDTDKQTWISYDNTHIMEVEMDKVLAYGHHKIAIAWGGHNCRPAQKRFEAYKKKLMQNGIPLRESYIRHGDWSFNDGMRFYKEFMNLENPPTAIIFMNDEMAMGAIEESMRTDRKVLDEVSIIGFNNMEYTRFSYPSITTVQIPLEEIGYRSAEQLIHKIENREYPEQQIMLNCKLIERESLRANPHR